MQTTRLLYEKPKVHMIYTVHTTNKVPTKHIVNMTHRVHTTHLIKNGRIKIKQDMIYAIAYLDIVHIFPK